MTWWVFLQKNKLLRVLSEHSELSTLVTALQESDHVWEVQADHAWAAVSKLVSAYHTLHPEKQSTPKLTARMLEALRDDA